MRTTEFTTPLVGTPYHRSVGIIKVYDEYGNNYNVGEIIYEIFDEENYQYIFKPYWDLIECIPKEVFSGIPGINMDIKKELYYRVNMTPVFISQRSPSKNRENLKELLDSVGLDYYDRFEWMLRTETRCGDDNFFVVRKPNVDNKHKKINEINSRYLNPDDMVEIERLGDITKNNSELIHEMFKLLQSGAQIYIKDENRYLEITERKIMLYLLINIMKSLEKNKRI